MKYWIICKEDEKSLNIKTTLLEKIHLELDKKHPDIVVVVGGDGTFIAAVHQYPEAIFFGIHTGHLGFYANYTMEDLPQLIEDVNQQGYTVEKIDVLQCELKTSKEVFSVFAINEVTFIKPPKTLILDVVIDEQKLETFRGTGLCISTAYGSTAYNKSLLGAVVDPKLKAFQITEIAGINSNLYRTLSSPLILTSNRTASLHAEHPEEVFVTADHLSYHLKDFISAEIHLVVGQISIAHPQGSSFIERIRRTFLMK